MDFHDIECPYMLILKAKKQLLALPIEDSMESIRPMFTERNENHNVTSGKTAITSYLDSKDCSSNHKTKVLRYGNSSTSII